MKSQAFRLLVQTSLVLCCTPACSSKESDQASSNKVKGGPDLDGAVTTGNFAAPFHVSITVPNVQPSEEGTKCIKLPLGNAEAVEIGRVHNKLSPSSHHLVVSAVDDPSETEAPLYECAPFKAVLIGAPLTVTQKHDDLIDMPSGVAFPLAAGQLMHLEMHYINSGTEPADVVATSDLYPLAHAGNVQEASFLIVGNLDIQIPPNSEHHNPPAYVSLPSEFADVNFYAATGHTHRFGMEARLATAADETDTGTEIYNPTPYLWTEAQLKYYDPPLHVPTGGGFRFDCAWNNPTDKVVTYGESALAEMCFFWTYYYPRREGPRTLITGFDKSPYGHKDAGASAHKDAGAPAQ
jgi:hypothetical protein